MAGLTGYQATPDGYTKIFTDSPFSGQETETVLEVEYEDFHKAVQSYNSGELLQVAFHMLDAGTREMIKTGITPTEWDAMCPEEED